MALNDMMDKVNVFFYWNLILLKKSRYSKDINMTVPKVRTIYLSRIGLND